MGTRDLSEANSPAAPLVIMSQMQAICQPIQGRDIFDVSIFQRPKYTLRIFGAGVDLLAAVGGEAALLFCRRRPVFSSFDDPWAPPVPAEERRLVCLIRG
ncbi:hypothetical protein, partial [Candidatus Accumulibacter vicinus]|uniref:hypothetical protein n=1 Tax=Candidatus Accumulibacter vicinus TaxID=2954382 RepID=UPI00235B6031